MINPPRVPLPSVRGASSDSGQVRNLDRIHSNLNLGLLCLANSLQRRSHSVQVLDLDGVTQFLDRAVEAISLMAPRMVGISCLYHSTYPATQALVARIRDATSTERVVSGGTHIGCLAGRALRETPGLDAVCVGEGEESLPALLETPSDRWSELPGVCTRAGDGGRARAPTIESTLDLGLYPRAFEQVCVLEESRGCPSRCAFCHHTRRLRERPLSVLRDELAAFLAQAPPGEPQVTVASDTCGLRWARLEGLLHLLSELQSFRPFRWGTQTRADAEGFLHPDAPRLATRSGLASLSVGLESGSSEMLRIMEKAECPERYLENADRMLAAFGGRKGLLLRLSVLLYAGETAQTVEETRTFLRRHRGDFDGLHTAVLHAYPGTRLWAQLSVLQERYGTTCVRSPYWETVHAYPLNPSNALDFQQAQALALDLRTEFNSKPGE